MKDKAQMLWVRIRLSDGTELIILERNLNSYSERGSFDPFAQVQCSGLRFLWGRTLGGNRGLWAHVAPLVLSQGLCLVLEKDPQVRRLFHLAHAMEHNLFYKKENT